MIKAPVLTIEQFKSNFQSGDVVCRDRNGYPLLITAIGLRRFLFVSMSRGRDERVAMIQCYSSRWRKWDPNRYPDSQYKYVTEMKPEYWNKMDIQIDLTGY